ncbi:MAG: tetratricopeptide repeat protein, partial [Bacteroidota bacterium]
GFLYIIDEYGSTKAGKLANYYAGICYLRLGQFQEAIDYLDNFSSDDVMVGTVAIGATGDAYMELGDTETAIEKYLEAADNNPNDFTTPIYLMKAGRACEILGDYTRALQIYERIDADFKDTQEGRFIEKYITQAKLRIK